MLIFHYTWFLIWLSFDVIRCSILRLPSTIYRLVLISDVVVLFRTGFCVYFLRFFFFHYFFANKFSHIIQIFVSMTRTNKINCDRCAKWKLRTRTVICTCCCRKLEKCVPVTKEANALKSNNNNNTKSCDNIKILNKSSIWLIYCLFVVAMRA